MNFSPLKTESDGKLIILQNQIFEYLKTEKNLDDFESNKIEIEIWSAKIVNNIFESVKASSSKTKELLKKDLLSMGFDEESAEKHSTISFKKLQEDFDYWKSFFEVKNENIKFSEEIIFDFWDNEEERKYILMIE